MKNSHASFEVYYHEFKDKVLTYLMYRVGFDRDKAEDLLMDIFLKAFHKFDSFDENKGKFKTWIFTIAHNHLVNFYRDRKVSSSLDALQEESGFEVSYEHVEDFARNEIERVNLLQAFNCLNGEEKEVLTMRYLQEMSVTNIAEITGRNEGAMRTYLSRALDNLRKAFKRLFPNQEV